MGRWYMDSYSIFMRVVLYPKNSHKLSERSRNNNKNVTDFPLSIRYQWAECQSI